MLRVRSVAGLDRSALIGQFVTALAGHEIDGRECSKPREAEAKCPIAARKSNPQTYRGGSIQASNEIDASFDHTTHWRVMNKQIIATATAPAAIGIYSQAVKVGNTVWLSGQIPLDPQTQKLVKGDAAAQIKQVFENLKAVVTAAGATFDDVVKVNVYLTDLANSGLVNKVMAEYFREPYPARGAVGVASLAAGAQVEVECIVAV
jgi:reactive intermediate/imine deaminase